MPRLKPTETTSSPNPVQAFATVNEAAAYLHVCRAAVYSRMDDGSLAYAKFGRSRRIRWSDLHEYVERCTVRAS